MNDEARKDRFRCLEERHVRSPMPDMRNRFGPAGQRMPDFRENIRRNVKDGIGAYFNGAA